MNKKRILTLTCIAALLLVIFASFVTAGPLQNLQNFFTSGYKDYNKLLDFMVFTILFFAAAYLGFSRWFGSGFGSPGDARGAVVGLSLALALALSFAVITQTNFSLTSLFPISLLFIFFILVLLIYGLIKGVVDNWFLSLLFSLIIAYLLFSVFLFFYCNDPDTKDSTICKAPWMKWATFWQNAFGQGKTSTGISTGGTTTTPSGTGTGTTGPAAGPTFSKSFCYDADHLPMQSRFYPDVQADDGIVHHQEVINYIYLQAGWDYKTYPEGELVPEETAQQAFRVEAQKYGLDITKDLVNPGRKKVFDACIDYKNMADATTGIPKPARVYDCEEEFKELLESAGASEMRCTNLDQASYQTAYCKDGEISEAAFHDEDAGCEISEGVYGFCRYCRPDYTTPPEPAQPGQPSTPSQPGEPKQLTSQCEAKAQEYKKLIDKYADNTAKGTSPALSLLELNEMKGLREYLTDNCRQNE